MKKILKKIVNYIMFWLVITLISIFIQTMISKYIVQPKQDIIQIDTLTKLIYESDEIIKIYDKLPFKKTYASRDKSKIDRIIIHHTAGDLNISPNRIAEVGMNRFGFGHSYHFQIQSDGTIYQTNLLSKITAHCAGNNSTSIGIVITGNYNDNIPSEIAITNLIRLINCMIEYFPLINSVEGHGYYNNTDCPGTNINNRMIEIQEKTIGGKNEY